MVNQALVIGVEMELKLAKACWSSQKPSPAVSAGISQARSSANHLLGSARPREGTPGAARKREQPGAAAGQGSPAAKEKAGYIKVTVKTVNQALVIGVEMELELAKACRCSHKPSAAVAAGISQAGSRSSQQRGSAGLVVW
jgi:hypothetical protein